MEMFLWLTSGFKNQVNNQYIWQYVIDLLVQRLIWTPMFKIPIPYEDISAFTR